MVLAREFSRSSDTFRALRVANLIRQEARELMTRVDLLITPVNSAPAFPIVETQGAERGRELPESPKRESVTGRLTTPFNVLGMPAISVPCAFTGQGLPVGLQIAGRHFEDHIVLQAARAFERSVGPGYRRPTVVVDRNK
jgi:Asp-tRNA(Asn)/Glu-tRNA(Gln) amidotransferase A subunit family amidase